MEKTYQSYYTKSDIITEYMVKMIDIQKDDVILEPSAGDGVFIEKMLEFNKNIQIHAYDINNEAVSILNTKFNLNKNIKVCDSNTLLDEELDNIALVGGTFDKVIGNPPYGGWLDYDMRELLKNKYKLYSKETYSLFLARSIELLRDGGKLSFIIPDTYLFLHRHTELRKFLLLNTKIKEVLIFPSRFFPGVKFGYSNLSIITLEKDTKNDVTNNNVRVITGFEKIQDISNVDTNMNLDIKNITQREVFESLDSAFLINADDKYSGIINGSENTLGDIAHCVTGIYTGNNIDFMKVRDTSVRNAKSYPQINKEEIAEIGHSKANILEGISDEYKIYLPIVKGSSNSKYIRKTDDWYINWSKDAIHKYHTNKKARFQNSQFYFKNGIGVPMVKSKKIAGTLLENKLFDQSIVGVFPKDERHLYFLLGLFNSEVFKILINIINPSANNSANYIKKVPIVLPSDEDIKYVTDKVTLILDEINENKIYEDQLQEDLNEFFFELYGI